MWIVVNVKKLEGRPPRPLHISATGAVKFVKHNVTGSVKVVNHNVMVSIGFVKDNVTGSVNFVQDKLINSPKARNGTLARTGRERA